MAEKDVNTKTYDKFLTEIDVVLESKRISYAQFSQKLGISAITFYNRYKSYGFTVKDMTQFLKIAKAQPTNMIRCLKCGSEFMPRAKSVKRAFCDSCKSEMRKKSEQSEVLRFKYPAWVTGMTNWAIRNLVEQEFHIDEETAHAMSNAVTVEEAKAIRSNRWKGSSQCSSSVVYDTMNEIRFG